MLSGLVLWTAACQSYEPRPGATFTGQLRQENFKFDAADLDRVDGGELLAPKDRQRFQVAIMNQPCREFRSDTPEWACMSAVGVLLGALCSRP